MMFVFFACWAPEIAPTPPSASPVELLAVTRQANGPTLLIEDDNQSDEDSNEPANRDTNTEYPEPYAENTIDPTYTPGPNARELSEAQDGSADDQKQDDTSAEMETDQIRDIEPVNDEPLAESNNYEKRSPPYTTWTTTPNIKVFGPRGGEIITIENIGVRVEVLNLVDDWAQVICSGCTKNKQNQAGWLSKRHVVHPDEIEIDSPVLKILEYRRDWAQNKDLPEGVSALDLCMLVDSGYQINEDVAQWDYMGGKIQLDLDNNQTGPRVASPEAHSESGWRCSIERGQIGELQ